MTNAYINNDFDISFTHILKQQNHDLKILIQMYTYFQILNGRIVFSMSLLIGIMTPENG